MIPRRLPRITGDQLIRLLERDGFVFHRQRGSHISLRKPIPDGRTLVAVVPATRQLLPTGTLMAILGPKQTNLGRDYLIELIEEYGLR